MDQLKSATLAKDVARLGEECRELIKQLKSTIVSLDIVHKPQTDAVAANSTTCATPADPYAATRIHTRLLKENEEIVQTCFSLEIEICIRLHDWDGITPVLEVKYIEGVISTPFYPLSQYLIQTEGKFGSMSRKSL